MAPANLLALALATSLVCSVAALAIDTNGNNAPLPVPVTGDNTGPRYDIDMGTNLVDTQATSTDRKETNSKREEKITEDGGSQASPKVQNADGADNRPDNNNDDDQTNPGRLAIRRLWIYSDPIQPRVRLMHPWVSSSSSSSLPMERTHRRPTTADSLFSMMSNTDPDQQYASPFFVPHAIIRPAQTHVINPFRSIFSDVFANEPRDDNNNDKEEPKDEDKEEASPVSASTTNVEAESRPTTTTLMRTVDPHQLILDMLQQALSTRMGDHFGSDFGSPSLTPGALSPAESSHSEKPEMKTESKEDIVEIGGEKYRRKTVVSKHVGENVMFMTKKYILTPLNETAPTDKPKTNATETTQIDKRQQGSTTTVDKPAESPSITTPTVNPSPSTTTTTVAPSSDEVSTTTTTASPDAAPAASGASSPTQKDSASSSSTSKDTIEKEGESESVAKKLPEFHSPSETRERVIKRKGGDHED